MAKTPLGELYDYAMEVKTKEDADRCLKLIIDQLTRRDIAPQEAKKIALDNIGYTAGYYSSHVMKRVYELFGTEHPILGPEPWTLSPEDVFRRGISVGEMIKKRSQFPD